MAAFRIQSRTLLKTLRPATVSQSYFSSFAALQRPTASPVVYKEPTLVEKAKDAIDSVLGTVKETAGTVKDTVTPSAVDQHHHETRPHHPGKSDIDHLESPTSTEEAVHADRLAEDPLKGKK